MDGNFITQFFDWIQTKWGVYASPIMLNREYEEGVLLLFGKYQKNLRKGVNFKLFWPIHEAHKCVTRAETISTDVIITSRDSKIVSMEIKGEYEIVDARKWLLSSNDALSNIRDLFPGWAADVASDFDFEALKNKPIRTSIRNKLNEKLVPYGVKFNEILISKVSIIQHITISGIKFPEGGSQLML